MGKDTFVSKNDGIQTCTPSHVTFYDVDLCMLSWLASCKAKEKNQKFRMQDASLYDVKGVKCTGVGSGNIIIEALVDDTYTCISFTREENRVRISEVPYPVVQYHLSI